jgi:F-type H+-transporting ATPase subunit alpha
MDVPIGRGQPELIRLDRQTGKTAIPVVRYLIRKTRMFCAFIARSGSAAGVAKVVVTLRENGAMSYTVVVVTEGSDPRGLAYIAYAATSIAEYFMGQGRGVLIVYHDLTHHARAYRELSLLLRRPPGREAYLGDIFYIHSRLLERATHLRGGLGGGSLTALPIVETEAQDISAYISTNLISITDGQIYLSPTLFELGVLPAIGVGKSVSRVGGKKAQGAICRAATSDLKLDYAQFEELEVFAGISARFEEDARPVIEHGRRIRACLKQPESAPVSVTEHIVLLLALGARLLDNVPADRWGYAELTLTGAVANLPAEFRAHIACEENFSDEDRESILRVVHAAIDGFGLAAPLEAGSLNQEPGVVGYFNTGPG